MKKFMCYVPRQQKVSPMFYDAVDNQTLEYGDPENNETWTAFPLVIAINGYTETDEEIEVCLFAEEREHSDQKNLSRENFEMCRDDILKLCEKKGVRCSIKKIIVPFDDDIKSQMRAFQIIVQNINDGDELYVDISYSSKVTELIVFMALRYARIAKKNVYIESVVYGCRDFPKFSGWVYDETALIHLDDIVRTLAEKGDEEPIKTIETILDM